MRINKTIVSGLLAGFLMTGPALADDASDVNAVLEGYSAGLSDMDVAVAESYVLTDGTDFTIFEGSGTNIGWSDYRDHHLAPEFAAEHVSFQVYDWNNYSVEIGQDMASATFNIRMEYTVRGEERIKDAHGTAILVRTDDGWKIRHLHTS